MRNEDAIRRLIENIAELSEDQQKAALKEWQDMNLLEGWPTQEDVNNAWNGSKIREPEKGEDVSKRRRSDENGSTAGWREVWRNEAPPEGSAEDR